MIQKKIKYAYRKRKIRSIESMLSLLTHWSPPSIMRTCADGGHRNQSYLC